ncbi:unnamed protein product [Acanthoscelides obtectus]|uniref:Uncharacterized protein n=1 Tax=Acanthoscelides obtectus TaxID=200917 RepID=A0A9P0JUR2_ACAOB|nr:unnamed protein product [Acanthoscelides obtectus]CAK1621895.1 hypothetical protein AOBTE_LOCUS1203 [Acanthoscelides obtectus]
MCKRKYCFVCHKYFIMSIKTDVADDSSLCALFKTSLAAAGSKFSTGCASSARIYNKGKMVIIQALLVDNNFEKNKTNVL